MSEYTPTTENVRQTFAYVQAGLDDDDGYPFVTHIHVETFDRWLAEVERAAAEKAYARGCHDERHDCDRYGEYERGELTLEQLQTNLRDFYPYRKTKEEHDD